MIRDSISLNAGTFIRNYYCASKRALHLSRMWAVEVLVVMKSVPKNV